VQLEMAGESPRHCLRLRVYTLTERETDRGYIPSRRVVVHRPWSSLDALRNAALSPTMWATARLFGLTLCHVAPPGQPIEQHASKRASGGALLKR
jgi:hypothetical protein